MKFFAATLSDETNIYFNDVNFNSAEMYGAWRAAKLNLELVNIKEVPENEITKNHLLYNSHKLKKLCC